MRRVLVGLGICAVLGVTAMGSNLFGLWDVLLPKQEIVVPAGSGEAVIEEVDMISLSGYMESPGSKALKEWTAYLNTLDLSAIAAEADAAGVYPEECSYYQAYNEEMAEKLREIVEKYGLQLHEDMNIVSPEELTFRVGGAFLSEDHMPAWGYIYDDGTFQYDGDYAVFGVGSAMYQLRRTVKRSFDEVTLNITDAAAYQQWQYATKSGETVLLALGPEKALILGDFPDCFITVNILHGTESQDFPGGFTEDCLKTMSDSIDFDRLSQVILPQMRGDSTI